MEPESDFMKRAHAQLAVAIQRHLIETIKTLPPVTRARFDLKFPDGLLRLRSGPLTLDELERYDRWMGDD